MFQDLKIIHWPDPRLKKQSVPIALFNEDLRALASRMLELMREHKGVGLAAPQVGKNIRLFVINPTGDPADDRIYVNPVLIGGEGEEEAEEGCLSLPSLNAKILRVKQMRIQAHDLEGKPIEEAAEGFIPRIWQHETDHLNGKLITDHMGPVAKMASRRTLKELEEKYEKQQAERKKSVKIP